MVGLNYRVRGRCCVPVALRLNSQPCLPHGNPVLGLSLCPWHFCSCGDPQPGERLRDSMKPKFWTPHGLAVVRGSWTLCVEQADCAGHKAQSHPSGRKSWHLAGALTALPSSQHQAELAFEEELSCPRTVPALPGWHGKQPWQQAQGRVWARRARSC